ncbi:MAG: DUF72 domain-containing protein [Acidobacteriota bacterium]|nr:DUF72 domain-containing protein [Acidobacteriota bacterium]
MSSEQLPLFPIGSAATASRDASADRASLDARFEQLQQVAATLPPTLRMGTSSWSFPGWRGIVYPGASSTSQLAREGLRDYAKHPFFDRLPRDAEYAVQIRDRSLLTENYRRVVARNGAVHVCNYWSAMPMPGEQADLSEHTSAPFTMVRLLMRPGTRYEQQRETMAPFNRIVQQDEHMRRDTVDVLRRAAAAGQRTFLLVNNKAEGASPLTIEALGKRLAATG